MNVAFIYFQNSIYQRTRHKGHERETGCDEMKAALFNGILYRKHPERPGGRWESKGTWICSEPIVGEKWEENGGQRRELVGIRVGTIIYSLPMQYILFLWSFKFLVKFLNWWNAQVDLLWKSVGELTGRRSSWHFSLPFVDGK